MEQSPLDPPPLDPFAGYLEVASVIRILETKRQRILDGNSDNGTEQSIPASEVAAMVGRVDSGLREATDLLRIYEERIEDGLQATANRADSVRALFDSVTQRMKEMESWLGDAVNNLSDEDREEWDLLLSDYERIRDELGGEPRAEG